MRKSIDRITVICSGTEDSELLAFTESYIDLLQEQRCSVSVFDLNRMDVRSCLGCYVCNIKTPGVCIIKDDQASILHAFVNSDRIVVIAPVVQGFMSGRTKSFIDRLYPMELPFIKIRSGIFTHDPRYEFNPDFGFILHKETDTDAEDLEIMRDVNRFIGNFYGGFAFQRTTEESVKEAAYETARV